MENEDKEKIKKQFTEKLNKAIAKLNIPQKMLAKKLGISESYISKMLKGSQLPNLYHLYLLKNEFGISIDKLLQSGIEEQKYFLIGDKLEIIRKKFSYSTKQMVMLLESIHDEKDYILLEKNEMSASESLIYEIAFIFGINPLWMFEIEKDKILWTVNFRALEGKDVVKEIDNIKNILENKGVNERLIDKISFQEIFFSEDKLNVAVRVGYDVYEPGIFNHKAGLILVDRHYLGYYPENWIEDKQRICKLKDFMETVDKDIYLISEETFQQILRQSILIKDIQIVENLGKAPIWDLKDRVVTSKQVQEWEEKGVPGWKLWKLITYLYECDK